MWRLIGVVSLLMAWASPADACTVAPTYDPSKAFERRTRDDIVKMTEVIVEGVVEPPAEPAGPGLENRLSFSRMHIDRVWKGAIASNVVVLTRIGIGDCSRPPPFGRRIVFGARLVEKELLLVKDAITLTPDRAQLIETHDDFLSYSRLDLPLQDPEFSRLLVKYRADTEALRQRANSGDRGERIAYAAHLFDNNELHRALAAYEGLLKEDPSDFDLLLTLAVVRAQVHPDNEPEATLAEVERKAPRTPEWQRKIVHARFVASGRLTPGWKDWSDLRRSIHCEASEGNFDDANFDRADLASCEFVRSSFRNASLLHTDLSDAYFEDSTLTGAKYNCATKLPEDLDPMAAGMINLDGTCPAP
jgi:hypothetical protein